jgi:hypothetical protein
MKYLKQLWAWIVSLITIVVEKVLGFTKWIKDHYVPSEATALKIMTAIIIVLSLIIFIGSDQAFEPGPTRLVDPAGKITDATMSADLAAVCTAQQPAFSLTVDGQVIELFISE